MMLALQPSLIKGTAAAPLRITFVEVSRRS